MLTDGEVIDFLVQSSEHKPTPEPHLILLRLWYIDVSGNDCGDMWQGTIHTLTNIMSSLEQAIGDEVRTVIGAPMRNRTEICRAIEGNREAVSHVGRRLAQKYDFVYPADLEATVLQGWQEFLASHREG
ncbi:MAG TPA: hypothetical protein VH593_28720 [Ktedonobacteraceae bacterium]|jgi:hypothetical protein